MKNSQYRSGINVMLVNLFNHVMEVEGRSIITEEFKDITNNDMHIIEAVGIEEPRKMSDIAKRLGVTVGTLTTNMNGLEKKGYIERRRSEEDKRVVYIILLERGRKAFFHHKDYHKNMVQAAVEGLDENERRMLYQCLEKLDRFFTPDE